MDRGLDANRGGSEREFEVTLERDNLCKTNTFAGFIA